jgi:hypothetical protein
MYRLLNSWYLFSTVYTARSPLSFRRCPFVARSGQESLVQGSAIWRGSLQGDLCPEGGHRTQPRVSTLGTLKIRAFALKGREADQLNLSSIAAQKIEFAIETCYNLEPTLALLVRSFCRPFRARRCWWRFPGLKPWAESFSPFGAKTSEVTFCKCPNCRPRVNPELSFLAPPGRAPRVV